MNKKYCVLVGSSFVIELIITEDIARMCYHSGDCYNDAKDGIEIPLIKEQLKNIDTELLINVVGEIIGSIEISRNMSREDLESWVLFEASALFIDGDYCEVE
jgi:hypothetical protein